MGSERVVVIGAGGAEAALVHKYSLSEEVGEIIAIPGNDTMQDLTEKRVKTFQKLKPTQTSEISSLVNRLNQDSPIAFVDIRSEAAIANGLTDLLKLNNIPSVSPSRKAGKIESDKAFARHLGDFIGLPQPDFEIIDFSSTPPNEKVPRYYEEVMNRVSHGKKFVKANGLADGKGVIGAEGRGEIERAIEQLRREFPESSAKILIEKGLEGEEFSAFAISNGKSFKMIGYAQDHKRAYDGDKGPNTGGMGAISRPLLIGHDEFLQKTVEKDIFGRVLKVMRDSGNAYKGILFFGGMAVEKLGVKVPYVIEFNSRWGDPETQVLLPGIKNDLFEMNSRILRGDFKNYEIKSDDKVRVAVAGASRGYPYDYSDVKGKEIRGIEVVRELEGVIFYGAGMKKVDGKYYADGGRLFYVVGEGDDVIEARNKAYEAMRHITVEGDNLHYRTDIGHRDVERLSS